MMNRTPRAMRPEGSFSCFALGSWALLCAQTPVEAGVPTPCDLASAGLAVHGVNQLNLQSDYSLCLIDYCHRMTETDAPS